nr:hypothetical protein [Tanacetum cinerariifolium]
MCADHLDMCQGKVFKSEIELQLGKKIKALRSDRGDEYLSQEFKDYLNMARSMFNLTTLPLSFWDYALESAVRILNMVPTKKGCEAYVKRDSVDKLHQRSVKRIFKRYPKETMGYYFYFSPENKVIVARCGNFLERDLISQKFNGRDNDLEDDHMDTLPSENTSEIPVVESESLGSPQELIPVRRSERTTRAPNRLCLNTDVEDDEVGDLGEPANYKAVMLDLIIAIRILIAITSYYDYEIWQMDVKTAFLNGRLDEDIYMEQPKGYVDPKYPNRVCKLQRSIYGLKQASRQWNKRFDEEIKKFGFIQNRDEPCVYRKASGSDVVFLILYVDDSLIMGNNIPRLKEVKDYLGKCFSTKDLREAAYILGIKIYRDRSRRLIGLSQSAYIDKILKKYNMHNSKKGSIMYAIRCTKPDVAFAQNLVTCMEGNQIQNLMLHVSVMRPGNVIKMIQSLRRVMSLSVNGGAVDWKSKKQTTIAMHSAQAEYVVASEAAMEAVWIRKLLEILE